MKLDAVNRGRIAKPARVLIFGVEGVGKSTFAADAPAPIFLGAEDGTSELDVARFPEPKTWQDIHDAIDSLRREGHDYRTLAIDSLDWIEPLCWAHVCANRKDKHGKKHDTIEGFPYGQGYQLAVDEWRGLAAHLDALRAERAMHIVLIAHSHVKLFKNPEGDDFDRYELKLHAKSGGFLKEWTDAVLFAQYETLTDTVQGRTKGLSTGARVLYTQRRAAWDAKNRYDLPETLPLSWQSFADGVSARQPASPNSIDANIARMLEGMPADVAIAVNAAVRKANGDAAELARIANKLTAMKSIATNDQING